MIRTIFRKLLEDNGYTVLEAEGGHKALEILARPVDVACVWLDVNMPGLDGIETARRILSIPGRSDLPILFVTAETRDGIVPEKLSHIPLIRKPLDRKTVLDATRKAHEKSAKIQR